MVHPRRCPGDPARRGRGRDRRALLRRGGCAGRPWRGTAALSRDRPAMAAHRSAHRVEGRRLLKNLTRDLLKDIAAQAATCGAAATSGSRHHRSDSDPRYETMTRRWPTLRRCAHKARARSLKGASAQGSSSASAAAPVATSHGPTPAPTDLRSPVRPRPLPRASERTSAPGCHCQPRQTGHGDLPEIWSESPALRTGGALACSNPVRRADRVAGLGAAARLPGTGASSRTGPSPSPKPRLSPTPSAS